MTVAPPTGPHIATDKFRRGRGRMRWGRVVFLGFHTAEGGSSAVALGNYFRDTDRQVSSHCAIGVDGEYASFVSYADTAWTMAPSNDDADQVEVMGYAKWSRAEWLDHDKMLATVARWLAWRSEVRDIPLRVLTAAQARRGERGILMHRTNSEAWPGISNHTDPGVSFPWDRVLARARELQDPPDPDELGFDAAAVWAVPLR